MIITNSFQNFKTMNTYSRRKFLKTAAAGAAG
ncbi:MAG TPA: hypothetical protein DDZ69_03235, partial [Porphyromonadaceae bacterium]|nr:hypothetical protein [Porphyromonadaceae bacterium]